MTLLRRIVSLNIRASRWCELRNLSEFGAHVEYLRLAAMLFSAPDVRRVADIAAGSRWHFPSEYKAAYQLHLTGVDIDREGLDTNPMLDQRIAQDVCERSPIGAGRYDLLTCYSGIEHLPNVEAFLQNAFASLRPGGAMIAQFPSSTAPFALINRMLPQRAKETLLRTLFPSSADEIGYPVHYDKCVYSAFRRAAERHGFIVEYYLPSFLSSGYFSFCTPLFLIFQAIDLIRLVVGPRNLASYNLFILRRPGEHFPIKWSWHNV